MKKIFVIIACVFALVPIGNSLAQTILTVAAYPSVDEIVKAALPEWKKKHPQVQVKVVSREFNDHHTAMTTALAASSGLPDVMTIEYGYLGRFAQSGGLENLAAEPYRADKFEDQFVTYAWQQARSEKFDQIAIPADIGPGVMFYRRDILLKSNVKPEQLTSSWEEFIGAGKQIKDQTGSHLLAHARDIKDIVIRSGLGAGEGIYYDEKGQSLVGTSARFKRAFELAKRVRQEGLDAKTNAWSNEWGESIKRGDVAVQMMGAWFGGHLQNWLAPDAAGKWRSAKLPDGAAVSWGGTFYAIPKKAVNKELAWDLIQFMSAQRQQQFAFQKFNAFPALKQALTGNYFDQGVEYLGGQKARSEWRDAAKKIRATRVFRNDPIAEEIVNAELDLVLTKGKSIDQALADAHRFVQRRAQR